MRDRKTGGTSQVEEAGSGRRAGTPGRQTLSEHLPSAGLIQRKAAAAPAPDSSPAESFGVATSGPASALPHRDRMEAAFGTRFGDVRAHLGGPAAEQGLGELGAHAAAQGNTIAFRSAAPSERLVAHELAHVVQQRGGTASVQRKSSALSDPGGDAERRADAAADAVVSGLPVGDVGTAPAGDIHRAVDTNGGTWTTPTYSPRSGTGAVHSGVGAQVEIHFTPNALVEAPTDGIALTQSVKGLRNSVVGGAPTTPDTAIGDPSEPQLIMGAGEADPGREIDRSVYPTTRGGGRRSLPNTSPVYGVHNSPGHVATTLNDGTPLAPSQRGSHVRRPDGTFDAPVDGVISDRPGQEILTAGQVWEQDFEATALVTAGPMANTYLGSIAWGWRSDAHGHVTMTPDPVTVVSAGAPSSEFMGAAGRWNRASLRELDAHGAPTGTAHDTVDLPLTTVSGGTAAATDMTTAAIVARLVVVNRELATLRPGTDRTNKEFEHRALDTELRTRTIAITVHVNHLQDTGGAARPPEDEVTVNLAGPHGGALHTPRATLAAGAEETFVVGVDSLLPLDGPVTIHVMEHDRAGPRSRAHDTLVVDMSWAPPFAPLVNATTLAGGDYTVRVRFSR